MNTELTVVHRSPGGRLLTGRRYRLNRSAVRPSGCRQTSTSPSRATTWPPAMTSASRRNPDDGVRVFSASTSTMSARAPATRSCTSRSTNEAGVASWPAGPRGPGPRPCGTRASRAETQWRARAGRPSPKGDHRSRMPSVPRPSAHAVLAHAGARAAAVRTGATVARQMPASPSRRPGRPADHRPDRRAAKPCEMVTLPCNPVRLVRSRISSYLERARVRRRRAGGCPPPRHGARRCRTVRPAGPPGRGRSCTGRGHRCVDAPASTASSSSSARRVDESRRPAGTPTICTSTAPSSAAAASRTTSMPRSPTPRSTSTWVRVAVVPCRRYSRSTAVVAATPGMP